MMIMCSMTPYQAEKIRKEKELAELNAAIRKDLEK